MRESRLGDAFLNDEKSTFHISPWVLQIVLRPVIRKFLLLLCDIVLLEFDEATGKPDAVAAYGHGVDEELRREVPTTTSVLMCL